MICLGLWKINIKLYKWFNRQFTTSSYGTVQLLAWWSKTHYLKLNTCILGKLLTSIDHLGYDQVARTYITDSSFKTCLYSYIICRPEVKSSAPFSFELCSILFWAKVLGSTPTVSIIVTFLWDKLVGAQVGFGLYHQHWQQ